MDSLAEYLVLHESQDEGNPSQKGVSIGYHLFFVAFVKRFCYIPVKQIVS